MPESHENKPSLENIQHRIDELENKSVIINEGKASSGSAAGKVSPESVRMAWSMVSGATVGILGGYFLDRWLNTSPVFMIVLFFLGFAVGLYGLIRNAKKND